MTGVTDQGHVFGCGATQYGQLGNSFLSLDKHVLDAPLHTPHQLAEIPPMLSVAAGAHHSVLLDGELRDDVTENSV